jgi:hypothetical protein
MHKSRPSLGQAPTSIEVLEGSPLKRSESKSDFLPINLPDTKEGQQLEVEVRKYWVKNIIRADPTEKSIPLDYRMQVLNGTCPLKLDVDLKGMQTTVYMRRIRFKPGEQFTERLRRAAGHSQTENAERRRILAYILTFSALAIFGLNGVEAGKGD